MHQARTEREKEIINEKLRDLEDGSRSPPPKSPKWSFRRILHNRKQALLTEMKREILP